MMQIRPDGSFAKPNDLRVTNKSMKLDVNQVTEKRKTEMTEILDELLNFGFGTTTNGEHHCTGVPGGTSSNISAFTPSSNHCFSGFCK
jgi:hypothetical protein